jgi:hypothetical protein
MKRPSTCRCANSSRSQQEIEKAVRAAVADGRLKGVATLEAQMVLTIGKIALTHKVDGTIELE